MTSDPYEDVSENSPIYTHPDLRSSNHEWLLARLQMVRDRRLVSAILYERERVSKVHKIGSKLQAQWEKLNEANRLKLHKIDEAIDALDRAVSKQVMISHQISLVEDE